MVRLQKTLDHEVEVLEHQFSRNLVRTANGEARFADPHRIEVTSPSGETRIVSAAHILIACGTRPFRPDYVPFDGKPCSTATRSSSCRSCRAAWP